MYLQDKQTACLAALKELILFMNSASGLVSSELRYGGVNPTLLNTFMVTQFIQAKVSSPAVTTKPLPSQTFRYPQEDWNLLQQLILDQMTKNNINI